MEDICEDYNYQRNRAWLNHYRKTQLVDFNYSCYYQMGMISKHVLSSMNTNMTKLLARYATADCNTTHSTTFTLRPSRCLPYVNCIYMWIKHSEFMVCIFGFFLSYSISGSNWAIHVFGWLFGSTEVFKTLHFNSALHVNFVYIIKYPTAIFP